MSKQELQEEGREERRGGGEGEGEIGNERGLSRKGM